MVLPLLPVVESLASLEDESRLLPRSALAAIGQILVRGEPSELENILKSLGRVKGLDVVVDVPGLAVEPLIQILDAGAAKVVVTKNQLSQLTEVPPERILVQLAEAQVATPAGIEDIANTVSGIIIDSSYTLSVDPESLKSIVTSLRKSFLPAGGERTVYMQYSRTMPQPTISKLKSLALLSITSILPEIYLTSSPKENPSLLSIAQIALLGAKTDRPDGLYTTVVTDERGLALGLVYSS